jgi:hypothetical protein
MSPEYWRSPDGRKVAATLIAVMTFGAAACGDDGDGGETADRPEGATTAPAGGRTILVDATEVTREFAGVIEGAEIYGAVALTRSDDGEQDAIAYFCDSSQVAELLTRDEGDGGDEFRLANPGGSDVTVTLQDGEATGTGTLADGTEVTFALPELDADGQAGFYVAFDEEVGGGLGDYGGWIVLPDGSQRGNLKFAGMVQPGGQINPATGVVTGTPVISLEARPQGFMYFISDA